MVETRSQPRRTISLTSSSDEGAVAVDMWPRGPAASNLRLRGRRMAGGDQELVAVRVGNGGPHDRAAGSRYLGRLHGDGATSPADLLDRGPRVVMLEHDAAHGAGFPTVLAGTHHVHRERDRVPGKGEDGPAGLLGKPRLVETQHVAVERPRHLDISHMDRHGAQTFHGVDHGLAGPGRGLKVSQGPVLVVALGSDRTGARLRFEFASADPLSEAVAQFGPAERPRLLRAPDPERDRPVTDLLLSEDDDVGDPLDLRGPHPLRQRLLGRSDLDPKSVGAELECETLGGLRLTFGDR